MNQPEPYRYVDEDGFCLSARLLPNLNTGGVTDTLSITVEGDGEPQSAHVPAAEVERALAGIRAAAGTQPAADEEQRELRARLLDYENRITWETNCGEHARLLDSCRAADERAERAEAENARLRAELEQARSAALREGADAIDHLRATMLAPPVADRYASGLSGGAGELRRLADDPQQAGHRLPGTTETQPLCGNTVGVWTPVPYRPCARPAGHSEAYCKDATGNHLFLAADTTETSR